jgi:hypothetical protein
MLQYNPQDEQKELFENDYIEPAKLVNSLTEIRGKKVTMRATINEHHEIEHYHYDKDGVPTAPPLGKSHEENLPKQWLTKGKKTFFKDFLKNPMVSNDTMIKIWLGIGDGFKLTSSNRKIREDLEAISYEGKFWDRLEDWISRLFYEGEVFILTMIKPDGTFDFRTIEPTDFVNLGTYSKDGVVFLPEDMETVIGYFRKITTDKNNIVICFEPSFELMKNWNLYVGRLPELVGENWRDLMKYSVNRQMTELSENGYIQRFVVHLKYYATSNMPRGISPINTYIYFLNLYLQTKVDMVERKRSQAIFARILTFDESKGGKTGWRHVSALLDPETRPDDWYEQLNEEGLIGELEPGGGIICPPGSDIKEFSPKFEQESGQDDDIADVYTQGMHSDRGVAQARTDHTKSAIDATRDFTEIALRNIQKRIVDLIRFNILVPLFDVKSMIWGYPKTFDVVEMDVSYSNIKNGTTTRKRFYTKKKIYQMIDIILPPITIKDNINLVNALYGSKHLGKGQDMSREERAKLAGIYDFREQMEKKFVEEELYGKDLTADAALGNNPSPATPTIDPETAKKGT